MRRPSPALVIACLALFVSLAGTGYATLALTPNSVGAVHLKRNAVNSAKVADRSLLARDFKAGQLPRGRRGLQGPQGERGEKGEKGDRGEKGDKGDSGSNAITTVVRKNAFGPTAGPGVTSSVTVGCDPGQKAVGGGFTYGVGGAGRPLVLGAGPTPGGTGWYAETLNIGPSGTVRAGVWAQCAAP